MTLEKVYEDVGGLGWFQIRIIGVIAMIKALTGWSMMQMSFAGLIPDYDCLLDTVSYEATGTFSEGNATLSMNSTAASWGGHVMWSNDTLNVCSINSSVCSEHKFHGTANSVVTEWQLVCDRKWIKPIITSVQMAGVLVGAVLAGQLGDLYGRKRTNFSFFFLHMFLNVIAGFSISWTMFMVLRFFIGFCIGGLLVVLVPYMTEFLSTKWRPLVCSVPMWPLGVVVFAGTAWLFKDWAYLHFTCAALSLPVMFTYFIVPESPRWLAVQGRLKEANFVVEKMASANGKIVPPYTHGVLEEISMESQRNEKAGKKYSYWDILNNTAIAKISLIFGFQWCAISIIFYGLSFGVSSFSGNLYLNIALMSIVEIPVHTTTFFLFNKLGRRWTTFTYFFIGCAAAFAGAAVHYLVSDSHRDTAINVLSFLAKMSISGSWGATSAWVVESYPTVTRSVGYGWVNMTARIGGIIAPFALDLDYYFGISYLIMGILQVMCLILTLFVPETRGATLADNMKAADGNTKTVNGNPHSDTVKVNLDNESTKSESEGHLNLSMDEIKI